MSNLIEKLGGYEQAQSICNDKPIKTSYFDTSSKNYVFFGRNGEYNWWNGSEWKISYGSSYWDRKDQLVHLDGLPRALLEHRRANNIYEVGDYVVFTDKRRNRDVMFVSEIVADDFMIKGNFRIVPCKIGKFVHATDEEIAAGHRL